MIQPEEFAIQLIFGETLLNSVDEEGRLGLWRRIRNTMKMEEIYVSIFVYALDTLADWELGYVI